MFCVFVESTELQNYLIIIMIMITIRIAIAITIRIMIIIIIQATFLLGQSKGHFYFETFVCIMSS